MLLRPSRPLPRRFSRRASRSTSAFVKQRHKRHRQYERERFKRFLRRLERTTAQSLSFLRTWFWVAVVGVATLAVAVVLFSPLVRVREIRVRRTDPRLDSERIQRALRPVFGRHLSFVTSRDVETLVRGAMPDVSSVSLEKDYPSQLILTIGLHPFVARLRIDDPDAKSVGRPGGQTGTGAVAAEETHDYLTNNGLYVSLPFAAAGDTSLPLIRVVDWAARPAPSAPLLSGVLFERMQQMEDVMHHQFGLTITGRTVYLRAREFHLQTPAFSLWFDLKSSLEDQASRYRVFLSSVNLKDVREYVDLRLADRVVYK